MNKFYLTPEDKPILAKCIYEKLEFFVDNFHVFTDGKEFHQNGYALKPAVYIEAKFESALQYSFFAPRIRGASMKKKKTPLLVIPDYGCGSDADTIKFYNAKPISFDHGAEFQEIRFHVFQRDQKYFQIGLK